VLEPSSQLKLICLASQNRVSKKRRGKSHTISNPQESVAAVREAAKRIKNQTKGMKRLEAINIQTENGEVEDDKPEKLAKNVDDVPNTEEIKDKEEAFDFTRSNSGRFHRLEARPLRRSSISSTRKSDKTVQAKGKGYERDDGLLNVEEESGSRSPIRVPSPSIFRSNEGTLDEPPTPRATDTSVTKKKLEKTNSAEEAIKGALKPSGLEKTHKLGSLERRRRQRRAMYPPHSQVFSPEEQDKKLSSDKNANNGEDSSIAASLRKAGMNIKVVDIDIDENVQTDDKKIDKKPKQASPTSPTSKQINKLPSPTDATKPPLTSRSSTGSLVSSRAARIRGLMDNDIRTKKMKDYDRQTSQDEEPDRQGMDTVDTLISKRLSERQDIGHL
jgi:hypothetical protein